MAPARMCPHWARATNTYRRARRTRLGLPSRISQHAYMGLGLGIRMDAHLYQFR